MPTYGVAARGFDGGAFRNRDGLHKGFDAMGWPRSFAGANPFLFPDAPCARLIAQTLKQPCRGLNGDRPNRGRSAVRKSTVLRPLFGLWYHRTPDI